MIPAHALLLRDYSAVLAYLVNVRAGERCERGAARATERSGGSYGAVGAAEQRSGGSSGAAGAEWR